MPSKLKMIFTVLTLSGALYSQAPAYPGLTPYEDREAYAVYSALLESSEKPVVIVQDEIHSLLVNIAYVKQQYPVPTSVINDFENKNRTTWKLQPDFQLSKPYDLLNSAALGAQAEESWVYPHGYFAFSAVGFNPEKTMALVAILYIVDCERDFLSFSCKDGQQEGHLAVLRKSQGVWKEVDCGKSCIKVVCGRV